MRSLRLAVVLVCLALVGAFFPALSARAAGTTAGAYYPLASARLLDTRDGTGVPGGQAGKLGAAQTLNLAVAGRGGVPATGVSAVVVNVTATGGTSGGYLSAYPAGTTRPGSSSLNYQAATSRANTTTVQLGSAGSVALFNNQGSVHVLVDVVGFYANGSTGPTGTPAEFTTVDPERLADTRLDDEGILAADDVLTLLVNFGEPKGSLNPTVAALALNVTAVGAEGSGYLRTYDGGNVMPTTSTLNFSNGSAIANTAVVKTTLCQDCGTPKPVQFAVYNGSTKGVHVLVDLVGIYYRDTTPGLRFTPIAPVRIKDSRTTPKSPLTARQTQRLTAPASVAGPNTVALVSNLTAVAPTSSTFLTTWDGSTARPGVSNLNSPAGLVAANGAVLGLSATNTFDIYNNAGTTNYLVDVAGKFEPGDGARAMRRTAQAGLDQITASSSRRSATTPR